LLFKNSDGNTRASTRTRARDSQFSYSSTLFEYSYLRLSLLVLEYIFWVFILETQYSYSNAWSTRVYLDINNFHMSICAFILFLEV